MSIGYKQIILRYCYKNLCVGITFLFFLIILYNAWSKIYYSATSEESSGITMALRSKHYTQPSITLESRDAINLAVIFTKAKGNYGLQYNLKRALTSLMNHTHSSLNIYVVTDELTLPVTMEIMKDIREATKYDAALLQVNYVKADQLIPEVEPTVRLLQKYFTNMKHSKYREFLFFFSLFFYRLLPGIDNVILMDIDIVVTGDIAELHSHFSNFTESQVMGLCPELSPVYHHILANYRTAHPETQFGEPYILEAFPGYNSGVLLINLLRLKNSSIFKSYMLPDKLEEKTKFYSFQGNLGDQDLFTLMALDHPELFYTLPCTWNRQLCKWWKNDLYKDVFDKFFACTGEPKILHGNCKTAIPVI